MRSRPDAISPTGPRSCAPGGDGERSPSWRSDTGSFRLHITSLRRARRACRNRGKLSVRAPEWDRDGKVPAERAMGRGHLSRRQFLAHGGRLALGVAGMAGLPRLA